jgi:hypothetical protein
VALSSCEAKFMAATAAAKQALWLRNLLDEITATLPKTVTLYVDNNSAIALMKNPVFHGHKSILISSITLSGSVLSVDRLLSRE